MRDWAVIFDLDGVLTDTAELHYQSWCALAQSLGMSFSRESNEALRGLSREESLAMFLGPHFDSFTPEQRGDLMARKNDCYLERVARLTADHVFPGVCRLLDDLRAAEIPLGLASSSRNAHGVMERLGLSDRFNAIVDGNDAPRSKPDPLVFLLAAARLGAPAHRCVVVEDAASGVAGARAAGMSVVGVGPVERVGEADLCVPRTGDLSIAMLEDLVNRRGDGRTCRGDYSGV